MDPDAGRPLILVFDDDLVVRQDFLAALPARFVYRAHADDALSDVADVGPDAVFMDYSMNARLTGAEATRVLRARYPYEELVIIAISSDGRMNRRICLAGATDGVAKMAIPHQFDHIRGVIRAHR